MTKWFPVTQPMTSAQAARCGPSPRQIPWSVAEKAYGVYQARYGRSQTLERIAERGGWYAEELDDLFPKWRQEASEIAELRHRIDELEAQLKLQLDNHHNALTCPHCNPDREIPSDVFKGATAVEVLAWDRGWRFARSQS